MIIEKQKSVSRAAARGTAHQTKRRDVFRFLVEQSVRTILPGVEVVFVFLHQGGEPGSSIHCTLRSKWPNKKKRNRKRFGTLKKKLPSQVSFGSLLRNRVVRIINRKGILVWERRHTPRLLAPADTGQSQQQHDQSHFQWTPEQTKRSTWISFRFVFLWITEVEFQRLQPWSGMLMRCYGNQCDRITGGQPLIYAKNVTVCLIRFSVGSKRLQQIKVVRNICLQIREQKTTCMESFLDVRPDGCNAGDWWPSRIPLCFFFEDAPPNWLWPFSLRWNFQIGIPLLKSPVRFFFRANVSKFSTLSHSTRAWCWLMIVLFFVVKTNGNVFEFIVVIVEDATGFRFCSGRVKRWSFISSTATDFRWIAFQSTKIIRPLPIANQKALFLLNV